MSGARVLVVEDERQMARSLNLLLSGHGYDVALAPDGEAALAEVAHRIPDVILLDLMLPTIDGLEVCRRVRARSAVPIIVLSARGEDAVKVQALDLGADDYLTKPFSGAELLARIRAALRRSTSGRTEPAFEAGNLRIDFVHRRVTRGGREIALTPKEYDVLKYLVTNVDRVITHTGILRAVWGPEYGDASPYLRNIIHSLRRKIEPVPDDPTYIRTEPGAGYRFDPGPAR